MLSNFFETYSQAEIFSQTETYSQAEIQPQTGTYLQADRILVVDDLPDNYILLQTILESEGYEVEVAASGPEALDKIATCPPDLVLLDVMMPGMDGFEVTRRMRDNPTLPFIPVLLVTGYSDPIPADGFDAGADDFVRKPIDFDRLLHRIRAILQPSS